MTTLAEMVVRLRNEAEVLEHAHEEAEKRGSRARDPMHLRRAQQLASALEEIDRRLSALEKASDVCAVCGNTRAIHDEYAARFETMGRGHEYVGALDRGASLQSTESESRSVATLPTRRWHPWGVELWWRARAGRRTEHVRR